MKEQETINTLLAQERTLLASERTFSAWIRTALAAMAAGLAIIRLMIFKTETHRIVAHGIGEILIIWGSIIIILAFIDYKKTQNKIGDTKNYKSSYLGFLIIALPLIVVAALLIWITLP